VGIGPEDPGVELFLALTTSGYRHLVLDRMEVMRDTKKVGPDLSQWCLGKGFVVLLQVGEIHVDARDMSSAVLP